jgi:choline dehydrogenase-like flavoprotein
MSTIDTLFFKPLSDVQGQRFDYIVIGGGAYGTSFAHRALRLDPDARVLVLEKGRTLIPDHIQNLPPTYITLNTTVGVRPWSYSGAPNLNFMPQIPYVGGRALFWNAWVPQPDHTELPEWPQAAIDALRQEWYHAGQFIGRRYTLKTPGNANEALTEAVRTRLFAALDTIETSIPAGDPRSLDSAMATGQGVPPEEWAKFTPITVLVADAQAYPKRLAVVTGAEAVRLIACDGQITAIETTAGAVEVSGAQVILACSTLEAGFLMSRSFPDNPLVGKNLCGHIRSFLPVRVPARFFPALTRNLQAVAFYLPGISKQNRLLHTHISVIHNPPPALSANVLYKTLPDASTPQAVATYQDPEHVVIMLHTMGEFLGERSAQSWNYANVNAQEEAQVHVEIRDVDEDFWKTMDRVSYQIIDAITDGAPVEYQNTLPDGSLDWKSTPLASIRNSGLVHEAGTLWMGDDPATSVTNTQGQVHGISNLYGTGGMLFPRPGSFNPTLTGIAQSFALARALSARRR